MYMWMLCTCIKPPLTSFLLVSNFVSLSAISAILPLFLPNSSSSRASVFTTLQTSMLLRALSLFTLLPCVHVLHLAWLVLPSCCPFCWIIGGHVPVCVRHSLWSSSVFSANLPLRPKGCTCSSQHLNLPPSSHYDFSLSPCLWLALLSCFPLNMYFWFYPFYWEPG